MQALTVRWRGQLYSVATCLDPERAERIRQAWPDRIVDLATQYDQPPSYASRVERDWLARTLLRALGEPVPMPAPLGRLRLRLGLPSRTVGLRQHVAERAAVQLAGPAPEPAVGVRRVRP